MGYTKKVILDRCYRALTNASLFYTEDFINYSGRCSDTDELYTEIIAEFVLDHLDAFCDGIAVIKRNSSYKVQSHDGAYSLTSRREEENCAKKMFSLCKDGGCYNHIGRIIDYQTPLKATSKDIAGKIDLLAYDGKILRLLELKNPDSEETMLRCVLEGFTYLRTVDQEKLLIDLECYKTVNRVVFL